MAFPLALVEIVTGDQYKCGDCKACCTIIGVREIGKPYYTPCTNLCERGCSIYGDRPTDCRTYECAWRMGFVPALNGNQANSRPDQLGLLFDMDVDDNGEWLEVYETRPGAFGTVLAKLIGMVVNRLDRTTIVGVRYYTYGAKIGVRYQVSPDYPDGAGLEEIGRTCGRNYVSSNEWDYAFVEGPPDPKLLQVQEDKK